MNKNKNAKLVFWSGIIGNSLDHYDSALYVFLAPFLAPVFFPNSDPIAALILTYGLKSVSMFTRPIGAIWFGHLALSYSIKHLLSITLTGVAICTLAIGLIPSYSQIGINAPILLMIIRALQGVFAAGEHNIAALFILEHVGEKSKLGKASSYYLCSTMTGTLLASLAAWIVSHTQQPEFTWRIAFILGVSTGIVGLFLRWKTTFNKNDILVKKVEKPKNYKLLLENKWVLLKIIPISSFSFVTYVVPFIFFNNFVPLVTDIKISDLLMYNTGLLVIDVILIPVAGHLSDQFNLAKWMLSMSLLFAITIIPLFYLLPFLHVIGVTMVKSWIMVLGVGFVAPLNALMYRLVPGREKYLVTGFGYAIGTELLGRNTTAICLALWYFTQTPFAPALYVAVVSICASIALMTEIKTFSRNKNWQIGVKL